MINIPLLCMGVVYYEKPIGSVHAHPTLEDIKQHYKPPLEYGCPHQVRFFATIPNYIEDLIKLAEEK